MRCYWFEPGDHVAGHKVRLSVTRLQVRPDRLTPHPIIHVPGGPAAPGGQDGEGLWRWRAFQQQAGWPRDLIIYDPRGTGLSQPRISCPAMTDDDQEQALAHCFARLGRHTAEALGARAQIADLQRLIKALDSGRVTLWATSYGALIARQLAARHPASIQSMLLESPAWHSIPLVRQQTQTYRRRLRQLQDSCRKHLSCRLQRPSWPQLWQGLLAQRRKQPRIINLSQPPWRAVPLRITDRILRQLLLLSVYTERSDAQTISRFRRAMQRPSALAELAAPWQALHEKRQDTTPVYWSTRCQLGDEDGLCRHWPVRRLRQRRPVAFTPTLVLAGGRDVLTPASEAADQVLARPGWTYCCVPEAAHVVLKNHVTAQQIVRRYLQDTMACRAYHE